MTPIADIDRIARCIGNRTQYPWRFSKLFVPQLRASRRSKRKRGRDNYRHNSRGLRSEVGGQNWGTEARAFCSFSAFSLVSYSRTIGSLRRMVDGQNCDGNQQKFCEAELLQIQPRSCDRAVGASFNISGALLTWRASPFETSPRHRSDRERAAT